MASSANTSQTHHPGPTAARKQAAATVVGRVLGEDVFAALHEGFLKGDLTAVIPLLAAATTKPYLRKAAQEVFVAACKDGEANAAALLLEGDGVDGNAVLNQHCVVDEGWAYGDNKEGDTALTRAAREGRGHVVRALVESGKVDVNRAGRNGELPLVLAIKSTDASCAEALLAADGIDTLLVGGYRAETPLIAAAGVGNAAWVKCFLAVDGVATNHAANQEGEKWSGGGYTALMFAAEEGHTECVQALLEADGIAVNHTTQGGDTALNLAAAYGRSRCVNALLQVGGVDANQASEDDGSPLLAAIENGYNDWEDCTRMLSTAKHVDLNLPHPGSRHHCETALHWVCARKHAALAAHLLAAHLLTAGGCRFARDKKGNTPLDLAQGDKAVTKVFASGIDYWQRRRHGGHAWVMKEVVKTLLLIRQRLDTHALVAAAAPAAGGGLPHLPEEIWLAALGFLRSADFMRARGAGCTV